MRRELIAAGLALCLASAMHVACAQGCTLVFAQGRNPPQAGGPDWDALNTTFGTAVANALDAGGRRVFSRTASSVQIDPQAAAIALLRQADDLGCGTLAETAVFVDEQQTLVVRLRVYPLLPQVGDGGAIVGLRVGAPLFITQRELAMAALARFKPELLAQQMTGEYVRHDQGDAR